MKINIWWILPLNNIFFKSFFFVDFEEKKHKQKLLHYIFLIHNFNIVVGFVRRVKKTIAAKEFSDNAWLSGTSFTAFI